jgi:hypothetical protein
VRSRLDGEVTAVDGGLDATDPDGIAVRIRQG